MSKEITPCEKLGYKVGDEFEMLVSDLGWEVGEVVKLVRDDCSPCPEFEGVTIKNRRYDDNRMYLWIDGCGVQVRPISTTPRPAKQALADAIHQNGGWADGAEYAAQCKSDMTISFYRDLPDRNGDCWCGDHIDGVDVKVSKLTNNWHHTILSRDEYFTAYPETVKIEINNETERKVEVEMESESEMTIKVSDWHKSGELPPVGEVCLWIGRKENGDYRADLRTGDRVEVIAHYKPRSDGPMVAVFAYESRESIGRQTDQSIAKCFSPLRTERDKAIDEMVCEFIDHHGDPKGGERYLGIAAKLYDAGYRKEVK